LNISHCVLYPSVMLDISKLELPKLEELTLNWNKNIYYLNILLLFRAGWI